MGRSAALLAVLALGAGCGPAAPPYRGRSAAELERMLRDPDPTTQSQGAFGLSLLGPQGRSAAPALAEALRSPHTLVRQNAALALGKVDPGPEATPALAEALKDREWAVRRQAALALGELGPAARAATAALEKLKDDPEPRVRQAARAALDRIPRQ
jgi:HEAT repeat protein